MSCRLCYVESMSKRPNELSLDFLAAVGREAAREAVETARRAGIPVAGFDAPTVSESLLGVINWTDSFHWDTPENLKPALGPSTVSKVARPQKIPS